MRHALTTHPLSPTGHFLAFVVVSYVFETTIGRVSQASQGMVRVAWKSNGPQLERSTPSIHIYSLHIVSVLYRNTSRIDHGLDMQLLDPSAALLASANAVSLATYR